MASFQGDAAAWEAHLAEGNAKQARKRVAADVLVRDTSQRILLVDPSPPSRPLSARFERSSA